MRWIAGQTGTWEPCLVACLPLKEKATHYVKIFCLDSHVSKDIWSRQRISRVAFTWWTEYCVILLGSNRNLTSIVSHFVAIILSLYRIFLKRSYLTEQKKTQGTYKWRLWIRNWRDTGSIWKVILDAFEKRLWIGTCKKTLWFLMKGNSSTERKEILDLCATRHWVQRNGETRSEQNELWIRTKEGTFFSVRKEALVPNERKLCVCMNGDWRFVLKEAMHPNERSVWNRSNGDNGSERKHWVCTKCDWFRTKETSNERRLWVPTKGEWFRT